jgi:hypothetical protein
VSEEAGFKRERPQLTETTMSRRSCKRPYFLFPASPIMNGDGTSYRTFGVLKKKVLEVLSRARSPLSRLRHSRTLGRLWELWLARHDFTGWYWAVEKSLSRSLRLTRFVYFRNATPHHLLLSQLQSRQHPRVGLARENQQSELVRIYHIRLSDS